MAIRAWIAALVGLMLVPASAQALTVAATEFVGTSGTIIGVARDEVRDSDVDTAFPGLPGFDDGAPGVGTVLLDFTSDNFIVFATGQTTTTGPGIFTSTLTGVVIGLGSGPLPNLQIFQSAPNFQTPFSAEDFTTTATVSVSTGTSGRDAITQVASFFASSNHGGGGTVGDLNSDGQQLGEDLPILATIVCENPGSTNFCSAASPTTETANFSTIADENFAINNQLTFVLQGGDIANFEIITVSEIPLPAPMLLLLSGLAGIGAVGLRRRLA